jgi:hypothetical protein
LLAVPVFHGHAVQLRFSLSAAASLERVRASMARAGFPDPSAAVTPIEVIGKDRAARSSVSDDGLGAWWLWIVAGEVAGGPARQAVRLAARLGLL